MLADSPNTELVKKYLNKCHDKINHHAKQGRRSLSCHYALNVINVLLTGSQVLTAALLTVYGYEAKSLALATGVYSLLTLVFMRVSSIYSFDVLAVLHGQLSDNYTDLHSKFELLIVMPDPTLLDKYIIRYTSVTEKSHISIVHNCCFLEKCF